MCFEYIITHYSTIGSAIKKPPQLNEMVYLKYEILTLKSFKKNANDKQESTFERISKILIFFNSV